jgi:hypothetical protein
MTLSNWLKEPYSHQKELSQDMEKALVFSLTMCLDFQFPMKKRDL